MEKKRPKMADQKVVSFNKVTCDSNGERKFDERKDLIRTDPSFSSREVHKK